MNDQRIDPTLSPLSGIPAPEASPRPADAPTVQHDVPPPGARMPPAPKHSASPYATLPPGGRRVAEAAAAAAADSAHGAGMHANWATPVGATTHPDFKPGAEHWGDPNEEAAAAGSVRRSTLWAIVMLIGASLVLVGMWMFRNVSVERDLATLARHASLPAFRQAASAPEIAAVEPSAKDAAVVTETPPVPAPASGTGQAGESGSGPDAASPRMQGFAAAPVIPTPRKQFVQSGRAGVASSAAQVRPRTPRKERITRDLYAEVFRRCPPPGAYGALECRKHICNGAEGRGPACRHINKLKL
ncbi:hypothetical protein AB4Z19_06070 [Pseudoduganella sp. RAF19]|uniref:hypothetical protein n=2 Tax=unclassified Pseudoduganella TaxID=2637179 RepID=UPI003F9B3C8D